MKQLRTKGKRILALLLAFILLLSVEVKANIQLPVVSAEIDNVFYRLGKDLITGERLIRPTIHFKWEDPAAWAPGTGPGFDQQADNPEGYRITLENMSLNRTQYFQLPYTVIGAHETEIADNINLATGSLYKVSVRPYHNHINLLNGQVHPAPYAGPDPFAYAITDLDVKLESTDDSITVIWDDLGKQDFTYRIVYALGDYSNQGATQTFYNNKEGEVIGLTSNSPDVVRFYDTASRRSKLKYVLKEKIYPGQIYSVMIEPTVENYEGERVIRNRNYPLIHSVSTNIRLNYAEEGEYLRLYWKIPASFEVGKDKDKYSLTEARLVEIKDDNEKNIAIFYGEAGAVNYYLINKPKSDMKYQLKLTYKSVSGGSKPPIMALSNILLYSPSELRITPTKPVIPKLTTQALLDEWKLTLTPDEIKMKLADEGYLLNSYTYAGDLAEIFNQNVVFHRKQDNNVINLVWSAFRRKDIDASSPTYNKIIADLNTYYDIFITDDYNALSEIPEVEKDLRFEPSSTNEFIYNSNGDIIGFHRLFNKYFDKESQQFTPFKPNKIYYIKVVAKKKIGTEEYKSDPTIVSFYYDALGIYAPPVMTKPPLRELFERTTKESVTIGWKEKWYEVVNVKPLDNPPLGKWFPVAWVKGDEVFDAEVDGAVKYELYKSEKELKRFLKAVAGNSKYKFIHRMIDMGANSYADSTIKYKFTKLPYADVLAEIEKKKAVNPLYGFQEYFDELIIQDKKDIQPLNWVVIDPARNVEDQEELLHQENGLKANTAYMFVLYPYRAMKDGTEIYAHFPTPILVSTKPEPDVVEPDPTVPKLFVVGASDTSIRIAWNYNKDFTYRIKYSETLDDKKEIEVPVVVSEDPTDPNYPTNGDFFYLDVTGLFPDTSYNFYIQAINTTTQKTSDWSNAVIGRTTPILPPPAPPGFGIASQQDMLRYKYERPVSKDYFAVQWMKLNEDNEANANDKGLSKKYEYILEIADNEGFIDPIIINTSGSAAKDIEILEKTLVKINGLVPGKTYYARAKTRLTVSSGSKKLVIDSLEYTNVVRITTGLDGSEYDGDKDPNLEILPDRDYELIYNEKDKSLTFRFRYDQKGKDGKADNRVDQRLINELIKKGTYTYTSNLSKFKNKEVRIRRVEMPYPVYEAFLKHKVNLNVLAGEAELTMPMTALEKEVSRQKHSFGAKPKIRLELAETSALPIKAEAANLRSITPEQALAVTIESDKQKTKLAFLAAAVEIGLSPVDRSEVYNKQPIAYLQNANKEERTIDGSYDKAKNRYFFKTMDLGKYGLYSGTNALVGQPDIPQLNHWSEVYRVKVAAHMAFKNLGYYQPDNRITGQAFYNGLYAGVKNEQTIDFNGSISGEKKRTLVNSGLMPGNVNYDRQVTRMEAFVAFVRAYEMIQDTYLAYDKNRVAAMASSQGVSSEQAITLLKAESAGLLTNSWQAAPNRELSYGEYFTLLSKVKGW
ncbi:fibronectin type III domain-containing protein [Clostridiales bacterium COT073_COT-073]|nr:fibronectin type III domain-containing protein [Clostridiales bacterium COT073_COT-073]